MALELIANQIVPLSGMQFDSAALLQFFKAKPEIAECLQFSTADNPTYE